MNPADRSGNGQPKIGVYVCHCGTNIAGDGRRRGGAGLRRGPPGGDRGPGLQVHVLRPRPGADQGGHPGQRPGAGRRRLLLSQPARGNLPPRHRRGWHQPLLLPDGEHPRTGLLGAHGSRRGDRQGQRPHPRGGAPGPVPQAAGAVAGPGQPGGHGGGRRHRRHPRRADHGQRRQARLPRGAGAVHRRAHGPVRQDLPHPRLRRLHPHPEDDGGALQSQHHPVDHGRGRQGRWLRGQLHGDGPPQAPLHRRGRLRRLPGVHRGLRLQGGQDPRRVQPRPEHAQAGLHPLPAGGAASWWSSTRRPASSSSPARCKKTCVEACADRNAIDFTQTETDRDGRRGRSRSSPPASRPSTPSGSPYYGYGVYPNVYTSWSWSGW